MAISLKNLLLIAEETGVNPDGSNFDQRSLGYGDSEPLVIKDLPAVEKETNGTLNLVNEATNNFVRGGAIALGNAVIDDVKRLGKLLTNPNGLTWAGAQLALAATNPRSIISPRNRQTLPLNVLATAGTGAAGIRFRKDGLLDVRFEDGFNYDPNRGGSKYESSMLNVINNFNEISPTFSNHTLRGLYYNIFEVTNSSSEPQTIIKEYSGGAHSTFGIGNTTIKRYKSSLFSSEEKTLGQIEQSGYLPIFNQQYFTIRQGNLSSKPDAGDPNYSDYKSINGKGPTIEKTKTRINLYKLGDPGLNIATDEGNYDIYNVNTIDKISAASIFKRENLEDFSGTFKDYIKFRIAVVDTENPLNDNVILFRALLDNLADNFNGEWNSFKYNGRAEEFFVYNGFKRTINFGFKIHSQTRWEQKPLWRKLNYLVAQTAPEYKNRRMRGVFSRLTIGDWMNEIPGFFTSINLSWNTAYPWEIRHDDQGADRDLNEYPHILDVSCQFQPVHNFAPSNSPTTPFILPEIGVNNNRKYARQSNDENQDEFNENGIATTSEQ